MLVVALVLCVLAITRSVAQSCPLWRSRPSTEGRHFLAAVVMLRIYRSDPSQITYAELTQWLSYVNYAGVDHVYIYDAYEQSLSAEESLKANLSNLPFITYHDWSHPRSVATMTMQVNAYDHCRRRYGSDAVWHTAIDIDEYPFVPGDYEVGFMRRAITSIVASTPAVEISMQNFVVVGASSLPPAKWMLRRHALITRAPLNRLVKPIYRPLEIAAVSLHNNVLRNGKIRVVATQKQIHLAHVWGQRMDGFANVTSQKVLALT